MWFVCVCEILWNQSSFKFQLRNGEDLGYSTDCQPGFFVQTGGVVPPILYLESFCSWFLSNHAFSFCSCICWVSWSIQHKISLAFCHLTEYHLTNCTGSTLDPTKFNHWQLQNVLRIYVGRNFGWQRPNYKMSLGKIMLEIPTFSYFFDFRCIGFL